MGLSTELELASTRRKLRELEAMYEETRSDPDEDEHVREITLESLKRLINQLKEEIARYETRRPAGAGQR